MKVLGTRTYAGPNPYAPFPLVRAVVAAGGHAPVAPLVAALPALAACGPECPLGRGADRGGDAHLAAHVAGAILGAAGQPSAWVGEEAASHPEERLVLVAYEEERSAVLAIDAAAELVDAARSGLPVDATPHVAAARQAREEGLPGPSTRSIVEEAKARGIPALELEDCHWQLGHGIHQVRIQATMTSRTSALAVETADDKDRTKALLARAGVPVPSGRVARTLDDALDAADRLGYPVVVKPRQGNHGRGVTVGVADDVELAQAFDRAAEVDREVIVEEVLEGCDFRLLVVGHRLVAAARRDPAHVVGDGARTVRELVDAANADPRRGEGHERPLTRIVVDEDTVEVLAKAGLTTESVPEAGRVVRLKSTANLSTGGTATDVTDEVHPAISDLAETVTRAVGLDVCGIDVVAPHLRAPLEATRGGVCEVNAAPGFRMHLDPTEGKARNVAAAVVDMLFPSGAPARVPIVAVTGTNGKTTTSRLLAHVFAHVGGIVGLACTDGVEVRGRRILRGDYSGPAGAETVLRDPTVTHAVLEVARGGILRRGLGFDACDVGVLLNVDNDHLGSDGVHTLEDLARVKSTVVAAVRPGGVAVLNAEDPRCLAVAGRTRGRVVLFARVATHPEVQRHVKAGGEAVVARDGWIVRLAPGGETRILRVPDAPVTLGGLATCNVQNALAATAAALGAGVAPAEVAAALRTFVPSAAQTPGRLNLVENEGVRVLVDYGHNVPALQALESFLLALPAGRRIVSASATGNRRDEDLREFGAWLGRLYDEVHLSDPDPRGRPDGQTAALVREGVRSSSDPPAVAVHEDERAAIRAALGQARAGDLVVLQAEDVALALAEVEAWRPPSAASAPVGIAVRA